MKQAQRKNFVKHVVFIKALPNLSRYSKSSNFKFQKPHCEADF